MGKRKKRERKIRKRYPTLSNIVLKADVWLMTLLEKCKNHLCDEVCIAHINYFLNNIYNYKITKIFFNAFNYNKKS